MACPESIIISRHEITLYNAFKQEEPYLSFRKQYEKEKEQALLTGTFSEELCEEAEKVLFHFSKHMKDMNDVPVTDFGSFQGRKTAQAFAHYPVNEVYLSELKRTETTLFHMAPIWTALQNENIIFKRAELNEKKSGVLYEYGDDTRLYHVFHPEEMQKAVCEGELFHRYKDAENYLDLNLRVAPFVHELFSGEDNRDPRHILVVTHKKTYQTVVGQLLGLSYEEMSGLESPRNCGVTLFTADHSSPEPQLICQFYNKCFYDEPEVSANSY